MTTDRDGNRSNPYRPDPAQACERCVFGSGAHAEWCQLMDKSAISYLKYRADVVSRRPDSMWKTATLAAIAAQRARLSKTLANV